MRKLIGKITFWKVVLAAILLVGAYATVVRFAAGLGASTNLSDAFPWGLWIAFDVMVGVGLAAGGFTIAATVHIFHMEKYEPIGRPAVLTAFLGYVLVCIGLLFDLGQPWDIWHPIVMWNPHSVMFEVAWCVMLYTSVLALEFSPVVFERFGLKVPLKLVRKGYIVLVVLGVLLSMMHQSSLGTLFLIAPDKLYGLWYTPWLPVFFFITAVAGGLSMAIVESYFSHRAFGRELEDDLLQGLARAIVVILAVYLTFKVEDLAGRGNLGLAFQLTPEAVMFWGEMGLGVLLPMVLFATPRFRASRAGLFFAACLTVLGFIVNRFNVGITGMTRSSGVSYFPSWMELAITVSLIAAGFLVFGLAVKYLDLFPKEEMQEAVPPARRPELGLKGMPTANGWGLVGLWVLAAAGLGLLTFSSRSEATPQATAAAEAPAAQAGDLELPEPFTFPQTGDSPGQVTFNHESHVDVDAPNCAGCHQATWSLRVSGHPLSGEAVGHAAFEKGRLCGACHDGEKAFSMQDDCTLCHQ